MKVIGIGEQKTPKPFISACDRFVFIEVLDGAIKKTRKTNAQIKSTKPNAAPVSDSKKVVEKIIEKESPNKIDSQTIELIEDTLDAIGDDDGWAFLGDVGNLISKKKPNHHHRQWHPTCLQ